LLGWYSLNKHSKKKTQGDTYRLGETVFITSS